MAIASVIFAFTGLPHWASALEKSLTLDRTTDYREAASWTIANLPRDAVISDLTVRPGPR